MLVLTAALGLGAAGAACSRTDDPTVPEGGGTTVPSERVLQRRRVGVTVHADGFKIEIRQASVVVDLYRRTLARVDTRLTNTGREPAALDEQVQLIVGPNRWDLLDSSVLRTIPPGAATNANLEFAVGRRLDLSRGRLAIGGATVNVAIAGLDGVAVAPNAPVKRVIERSLTAGGVELVVHTVTLRFDDPLAHRSLDRGRALIVAEATAVHRAGSAVNLTGDRFRLVLPDRTAIGVRPDGRSAPNVVLDPGGRRDGLIVRFEIPRPVSGAYAFVLTGPFGELGANAKARLPFSL